jgi:hypothetical protein
MILERWSMPVVRRGRRSTAESVSCPPVDGRDRRSTQGIAGRPQSLGRWQSPAVDAGQWYYPTVDAGHCRLMAVRRSKPVGGYSVGRCRSTAVGRTQNPAVDVCHCRSEAVRRSLPVDRRRLPPVDGRVQRSMPVIAGRRESPSVDASRRQESVGRCRSTAVSRWQSLAVDAGQRSKGESVGRRRSEAEFVGRSMVLSGGQRWSLLADGRVHRTWEK